MYHDHPKPLTSHSVFLNSTPRAQKSVAPSPSTLYRHREARQSGSLSRIEEGSVVNEWTTIESETPTPAPRQAIPLPSRVLSYRSHSNHNRRSTSSSLQRPVSRAGVADVAVRPHSNSLGAINAPQPFEKQRPAGKRAKHTSIFSILSGFSPEKKDSRERYARANRLSTTSAFSGCYNTDEYSIGALYRTLERDVDPSIVRPFGLPQPSAAEENVARKDSGIQCVMHDAEDPRFREPEMTEISDNAMVPIPLDEPEPVYVLQDSLVTQPPVSFWDKSVAQTRRLAFSSYYRTMIIVALGIIAILAMSAGVLHEVDENLDHLSIAVVSFEGTAPYEAYEALVSPFVEKACAGEVNSATGGLGFQFLDPGQFQNDPANVYDDVYDQKYWAAIVVHSNATALLLQAVTEGNSSYDPRGAASIIYNEARDAHVYNSYIMPVLDRIALNVTTSFASYWTESVLASPAFNSSIYAAAPQALSPGISFTFLNLRPFFPPAASFTITVGLIYTVIIGFYSFIFFVQTHMTFVVPQVPNQHPPVKFRHLVIHRYCTTMAVYFFLALSYSLVSLAMQIPFSNSPPHGEDKYPTTESILNANPFGKATFIVYFLLNWLGVTALGLISENMAMFLSIISPLPYAALFMLFWIASNVSTSFYALELANDFYKWGYIWPLRQMVEGSKTLVMGTRSNLAVNFAVLLAWAIVASAMFPLACWLMRWKGLKGANHVIIDEEQIAPSAAGEAKA